MSQFSGEFLLVSEPTPHVFLVQFNRKPVNAFHEKFWLEYQSVLERIAEEAEDPRAIVIASALPKVFTAGIDINDLGNLASDDVEDLARKARLLREHIHVFQRAISTPSRLPFPVISAVHGLCIGLGMDIIVATDIRIAASSAKFSIKEVDVGLAADIGTLARLSKVAGNDSKVHELAYTARIFDSAEALSLGLLSRVVEGNAEEVTKAAIELGKLIAAKSPVAVTGTKKLLHHARDHSIAENLEFTALWNSSMLFTEDLTKSAMAALSKQKTPAEFQPLRPSKNKSKL